MHQKGIQMADENAASKSSKKKLGVSKTPPKNEARPLGTSAPKRAAAPKKPSKATGDPVVEKVVDTPVVARVDSSTSEQTSNTATSNVNAGDVARTEEDKKVMASISLTLDPKTRKSTSVVFKLPTGLRGSVRIAKTAFPNGVPPASLSLQSDSEGAFAAAKAKLTAEERKALRANAPKLTAAQKLAKLQERAAKLQAKIEAEASASSAPASM
jgi:hypothetical protein